MVFKDDAASFGSIDTIGLGGTWIDSLRWIRVLNAWGNSFPRFMLAVIVGSKFRQLSNADRRAFADEVLLDTISRNFSRNCSRALIASRGCRFSVPISFWTISRASLRSWVNLSTSISSSSAKDAVFVATSSSWILAVQHYRRDFVNIPLLQFLANAIAAFQDCENITS